MTRCQGLPLAQSEHPYYNPHINIRAAPSIVARGARRLPGSVKRKEHADIAEQALPLIKFYKGWDVYQRNLVEIIAPLSREQLALPAAAHRWTTGMLVQHMVANRVWWFQVWMGEGSPELAPIAHWDPADDVEQPALEAAELVAGLEATWGMIQDALSR